MWKPFQVLVMITIMKRKGFLSQEKQFNLTQPVMWLIILSFTLMITSEPIENYRLPGDLIPTHYEINMIFDMKARAKSIPNLNLAVFSASGDNKHSDCKKDHDEKVKDEPSYSKNCHHEKDKAKAVHGENCSHEKVQDEQNHENCHHKKVHDEPIHENCHHEKVEDEPIHDEECHSDKGHDEETDGECPGHRDRRAAESSYSSSDVSDFTSNEINDTKMRAMHVSEFDIEHYHLDSTEEGYRPYKDLAFFGSVTIQMYVKKATSEIVLHAIDSHPYKIDTKRVLVVSFGSKFHIKDISFNKHNFCTMTLVTNLTQGTNISLTIPFSGYLDVEAKYGLFYSDYGAIKNVSIDEHSWMGIGVNAKKGVITSLFEPNYAHHAFPCFDEPQYKAKFSINIGHHRHYSSLSNMPIDYRCTDHPLDDIWPWSTISSVMASKRKEYVWDHFLTTPLMSTYTVTFFVSQHKFIQHYGTKTPQIRVHARKEYIYEVGYASQIVPKILSYYEKLFNITYKLPKLDLISVPDYIAPAMEHWGCILFLDTSIQFDPALDEIHQKQYVARTISHELAHQWFGNLVTFKWFDEVWLNEGFATYFQSFGMNAAEPDWNLYEDEIIDQLSYAWGLRPPKDHAMVGPVLNASAIQDMLDEVAYFRGSLVIRMIATIMGDELFLKAIHRYLAKHSFGNVQKDDLWAALEYYPEVRKKMERDVSIKEVMDTWVSQPGIPVVNVTRQYGQKTASLKQFRYYAKNYEVKDEHKYAWWLPLYILEQGAASAPLTWLSNTEGVDKPHEIVHSADDSQWLLFNAGLVGPYHVNYDDENWRLLGITLNGPDRETIPSLSRAQLSKDCIAFEKMQYIQPERTLQVLSYLKSETDYAAFQGGMNALYDMDVMLRRSKGYCVYRKFVSNIISPKFQDLGIEGSAKSKQTKTRTMSAQTQKMQILVADWACHTKTGDCEETAMKLYKQWRDHPTPDDKNPIPASAHKVSACVGLSQDKAGNEGSWFWDRLRQADRPQYRRRLFSSLGCLKHIETLDMVMKWAISDSSNLSLADTGFLLESIADRPLGFKAAKPFLYKHTEELQKKFGVDGRHHLGQFIKTIATSLKNQKELDEFKNWSKASSSILKNHKDYIKEAQNAAGLNIQWLISRKKNFLAAMKKFNEGKQDDSHDKDNNEGHNDDSE